jgi:hypothetical protein
MSKEMLPTKLCREQGLRPESTPIVIKSSKKIGEGLILVLLLAFGVGILVLASIVLLPYVNSIGGNIFGGIDSSTNTSWDRDAVEANSALADSFKATDEKGDEIVISDGLARSAQITISGYSDSSYSTKLNCSIDALPVYRDGSQISLPGLPHGKHTFTISEPISGETRVRVFSWKTIPSG